MRRCLTIFGVLLLGAALGVLCTSVFGQPFQGEQSEFIFVANTCEPHPESPTGVLCTYEVTLLPNDTVIIGPLAHDFNCEEGTQCRRAYTFAPVPINMIPVITKDQLTAEPPAEDKTPDA